MIKKINFLFEKIEPYLVSINHKVSLVITFAYIFIIPSILFEGIQVIKNRIIKIIVSLILIMFMPHFLSSLKNGDLLTEEQNYFNSTVGLVSIIIPFIVSLIYGEVSFFVMYFILLFQIFFIMTKEKLL